MTVLEYWKKRLPEAKKELEREQFASSRKILRECIANYEEWIARAEGEACQR